MSRARVVLPERIEKAADGLVLRRWLPEDAPALGRAVAESAEHLRPWMEWIGEEPLPAPTSPWLRAKSGSNGGGGRTGRGGAGDKG